MESVDCLNTTIEASYLSKKSFIQDFLTLC